MHSSGASMVVGVGIWAPALIDMNAPVARRLEGVRKATSRVYKSLLLGIGPAPVQLGTATPKSVDISAENDSVLGRRRLL